MLITILKAANLIGQPTCWEKQMSYRYFWEPLLKIVALQTRHNSAFASKNEFAKKTPTEGSNTLISFLDQILVMAQVSTLT